MHLGLPLLCAGRRANEADHQCERDDWNGK